MATLGQAASYLFALVIGSYLHFNLHSEEAFPGLSSVIGGRYPERSIFQIGMAVFLGKYREKDPSCWVDSVLFLKNRKSFFSHFSGLGSDYHVNRIRCKDQRSLVC